MGFIYRKFCIFVKLLEFYIQQKDSYKNILCTLLHFAEHKSWFIVSQADCLWDSHSYKRIISLLITLAKICNLRGKEPDTFWIFIWQLKSYPRKQESKCTKCAKIFPNGLGFFILCQLHFWNKSEEWLPIINVYLQSMCEKECIIS